jgi:hypothetical protein
MLETARKDDKQEGIKITAGKFDTWFRSSTRPVPSLKAQDHGIRGSNERILRGIPQRTGELNGVFGYSLSPAT